MKGTGVGTEGKKIFSFTGIYYLISPIIIAGIITIVSCTKKYEFTMGNDFIDSQTRLQVIDTFSVDLSTILLDSITTSSTKTAFAGNFSDTVFGKIKCDTYFDLAYQEFPDIEEKAVFDSAAFIMVFNGDTYGDTTSQISLSIHMLNENIDPFITGYLYNNSSFDASPDPTGSITFYPWVHSGDTSILISANAFGEDFFNRIREKDQSVSSSEFFKEYIKGFKVTSANENNMSVVGFTADKDKLFFRMYYHIDLQEPQLQQITVNIGQPNHQFNNVSYDFSDTKLAGIKIGDNEKSSRSSGNKAYMQGLVGLLPKVRFPTLQEVLAVRRWKILRADLVLVPAEGSYDSFELPKVLHIYDTDKENRVNSVLKDSQGQPLAAVFSFDEYYGEYTGYTYDITAFINNELADAYFDYEHGLLIGLEQEKYRRSLDRLLIEAKNRSAKLRLYFLTY